MNRLALVLSILVLPGCFGPLKDKRTTDSAERHMAEILTDTNVERVTRVTSEPVDDPELDEGTTTVRAGSVSATAPAGHRVSVEVDERDAATTSNRTDDQTASSSVLEEARKTPVAVYIGGAILVAAGAVVAIGLGRILWGLALAIAGAGGVALVVAINVYPWVALIAVFLGLLAALLVGWELWQRKKEREALQTVVGGIERLDITTKGEVVEAIGDKDKTGEKSRQRTKEVVGKVKRDLGIG